MDRETYLDRLGVDLEPGNREPAPPPLRVVQQFVNSYNHELETERDRLGTAEKAKSWLVGNTLLEAAEELSDDEARRLREGREVIRALAGGMTPPPGEFEAVVRIGIGEGPELLLAPVGSGADRALGALLAIVYEAMVDGSWQRMKMCRECSWLFYDNSRNRSGGWCSMAICGNRAKNRSYRRRAGG